MIVSQGLLLLVITYLKRVVNMMPLAFADVGEKNIIKKVGGSPEVKQHLSDLGFVAGAGVEIISTLAGNLIVNVKDTRVAISKEMAGKIMV